MADPLDLLGALLDLVGPFLFPVVLFAFGLVGYGVLVALGRVGVLDDGHARAESTDENRDGGNGRRGGPRRK